MGKSIKSHDLAEAISQELTIYHEDLVEKIDQASNTATKNLVKITKSTAPVGERGSFKRSIASKRLKQDKNGSSYVWYVKAPDYRLTHLLVHGHATKDGGRTKSDPFLQNALDRVLPVYEESIKEAIKNG